MNKNVNVLSHRIDTIDTIDTKVNRLGASSAALAGLHPLVNELITKQGA